MRNTDKKGAEGSEKSGEDGIAGVELKKVYQRVSALESNFTAINFSRTPLALIKAGLTGELGHRELTANFRGLETAFKPIDAAIRIKRINSSKQGMSAPAGIADEFLGISQTAPQIEQK